MRRTVFLIYVIIVITTTTCYGDGAAEQIARSLNMTVPDVRACFEKANVKTEDLMEFDKIIYDKMRTITASNLKVGCFIACMSQKKGLMSGPQINLDQINKLKQSVEPAGNNPHSQEIDQIIHNCENQVKSKVDECEVGLKFSICVIEGLHELERQSRNNEDDE